MSGTTRLADLYNLHGEKLRYLLVGMWNTLLSFATFALAVWLVAAPLGASTGWAPTTVALVIQWSVWVLMVVNSTVMMKYFAFRSPGHLGRQIVRSYFVYLPAQAVSSAVLWVAMAVFGLSAIVGQAFAITFATVFSYIGHKCFTFAPEVVRGQPGAE